MAVTTMAAVGLGLAGVGSLVGASSANKNASKAADTSMAVANQNNALARDIYGQNKEMLSPFVGNGMAAGNQLNAMLGLSQSQPAQQQPQPNAMTQFGGYSPQQIADYTGRDGRFNLGAIQAAGGMPEMQMQPTAQPIQAQAITNPGDGFKNYIANSDYGFQFGEGANALNSGYAGAGTLQSGGAMKALEKLRQNLQSGYRTEYMGMLGNQQGVGLSAGSALAGVGQNFTNTISQNNNNAGTAQANALLSKQNGFANTLGMVGGGLWGMAK